ncbi:hypothetical protein D1007_56543 [Hordeum vulgare]|nr:hypothetical protein D1007_56543 [Hordeum vulgare]
MRTLDLGRLQLMPSGEVIPASGSCTRHRPQDQSPTPDVDVVSEETRCRSPPLSPRTTSRDIVDIVPTSPILDWLQRVACLGSKVQPFLNLEVDSAPLVSLVPALCVPTSPPTGLGPSLEATAVSAHARLQQEDYTGNDVYQEDL